MPDLRKAKTHADPEVRRRLDDLIPVLEMMATLTPKRVTAKFNKKPVKEILDEISVSPEISAAVLGSDSTLGKLRAMVMAYEAADWATASSRTRRPSARSWSGPARCAARALDRSDDRRASWRVTRRKLWFFWFLVSGFWFAF